jgi:hypothetical protein
MGIVGRAEICRRVLRAPGATRIIANGTVTVRKRCNLLISETSIQESGRNQNQRTPGAEYLKIQACAGRVVNGRQTAQCGYRDSDRDTCSSLREALRLT